MTQLGAIRFGEDLCVVVELRAPDLSASDALNDCTLIPSRGTCLR